VAEAVVELLTPVRERYEALAQDPGEVDRQLAAGAAKARAIAEPVLERARRAVGLLPPAGG
jgi:tryptophanyl-tRNA synthetase